MLPSCLWLCECCTRLCVIYKYESQLVSIRVHSTCQLLVRVLRHERHLVFVCAVVGPSSLEYSRLRHCEQQFWSDPPADELLLRRRIRAPDASDSASSVCGSLTASQTGTGDSLSSSSALSCSYFASAARHQRIFVRSLSHAAGDSASASSTVVRLQRNRPSLEVELLLRSTLLHSVAVAAQSQSQSQ